MSCLTCSMWWWHVIEKFCTTHILCLSLQLQRLKNTKKKYKKKKYICIFWKKQFLLILEQIYPTLTLTIPPNVRGLWNSKQLFLCLTEEKKTIKKKILIIIIACGVFVVWTGQKYSLIRLSKEEGCLFGLVVKLQAPSTGQFQLCSMSFPTLSLSSFFLHPPSYPLNNADSKAEVLNWSRKDCTKVSLKPPFVPFLVSPLGLTAKYKTHPKQTFSILFFWAQLNRTADCNASPLILTAMQSDETHWQALQLCVCMSATFSSVHLLLYKSIWKEI